MNTYPRSSRFEVWSRTESGTVEQHGVAYGLTFEDACKDLASESIDFWTHYEKGRYRGRRLYTSRDQALAEGNPSTALEDIGS